MSYEYITFNHYIRATTAGSLILNPIAVLNIDTRVWNEVKQLERGNEMNLKPDFLFKGSEVSKESSYAQITDPSMDLSLLLKINWGFKSTRGDLNNYKWAQ